MQPDKLAITYKKLFATPDGETVLADLKETFNDRSSIVMGDPYQTHAREGAREVYLYILEMLETAEENFDE